MADSDGEFVADDMSDDDYADHNMAGVEGGDGGGGGGGGGGGRGEGRKKNRGEKKAAWEAVKRSWDTVVEDAGGALAVDDREATARRRLLRDTTPLQRGIIRHVVVVVDMSFAMADKDLLPNRYRVALALTAEFVRAFFEQNPISQLGIIGLRDGVAVRISDLGGNPTEHLSCLREWHDREPQGSPSLQNALEMCRGALFHAPSHGTREVLVVYGALLSSDPGDIHDTIASLVADRIRVSIVGLSAHLSICAELCTRTNAGDGSAYSVAEDEVHFRSLFLAATTPPVTRTRDQTKASLLMMGFPSRSLVAEGGINVCACHNKPFREGYTCTRCKTKVCRLPAECPACGLTLILSTHLARSYHHLFPLKSWVEVPWSEAPRSKACYSCLTPFPDPPRSRSSKPKGGGGGGGGAGAAVAQADAPLDTVTKEMKGVSESSRYACEVCRNHFCIDCDVFAHEVIHNCPGCQSDTRTPQAAEAVNGNGNGNGNGHANGAMEID